MTGPTSTVERPETVSSSIFELLRAQIIGGELAPGDALPSERNLSERLACNRHAVREAVKRLQQAGLVDVAQGGATRVLDWRATGGLDLLAQMAGPAADGLVDPAIAAEIMPDVLEMRACIGADVARRCAERAPDELLAELPSLIRAVSMHDESDLAAREDAYAAFWARLVDGAGNLAYRLAFNSLVVGVDAIRSVTLDLLGGELVDARSQAVLVDALTRRDATAAETAARALLTTVERV